MAARCKTLRERIVSETFFSDAFTNAPFWHENMPRMQDAPPPPRAVDVLIIGGGYTGLCAAIQTAPQRDTVVIDAEHPGWGCSTRNGGQVSTSIKPNFAQLEKRFGESTAMEILREGKRALEWMETFIRDNNIECNFARAGRFHGAHSASAFKALQKTAAAIPRELNTGVYAVTRDAQHAEVGTDFYHGGLVYPKHASLDPARYHHGLLRIARQRGAKIVPHCRALRIRRRANGFEIETSRGKVRAADVMLATGGYTALHARNLSPWHRRRIIPVASCIIATEPLPPPAAEQLLPNARVVTDTRRVVVYYRLCPNRRRVIFGGRVSAGKTDARTNAILLRKQLLQIFPALHRARITHSWMGWVGYTFDQLPHTGMQNGMHYAAGYCGSGISLASYFGMKTGLRITGDAHGETALQQADFPARFYYRKRAWFLPAAVAYYRARDWWG